MKSLIIKNATIIDGSRKSRFNADILIEDEKITAIGKIDISADKDVIDANGKIVCPGFIDAHSHSDLAVLTEKYVSPKIAQGITTEMLCQDGLSLAPLPKEYISPWRKNLAGLDGDSDLISWDFPTGDKYLQQIENTGIANNVLYLVAHGNVRMEAMGLDFRSATDDELKKMVHIAEREMSYGAFAFSTGLIYFPHAASDTREVIALSKVAASYNVPIVIHQRSEADTILESMDELFEISSKSGVKMHISHFKICGKKNWGKIDDLLKKVDRFHEANIAVSFDMYPYVAGSTMLGVLLPPWVHDGGTDKLLQRLNDPQSRIKIKHDILNGIKGWDNFVDFAGFDGIFVTSVKTDKNLDCIGKSIAEIADIKSKDPFDALFDLLYEEKNAVGMYDYYGKDEHLVRFMQREECCFCTDGLLAGKPHPRVYGSFPRVLGKFVREEKVFSLEDAIYKMTHKPATIFNIKDRGLVKEGYFADLVIFDEDLVADKATFAEPEQHPSGIEYVLVNGTVVYANGQKYTDRLNGKVLRYKHL